MPYPTFAERALAAQNMYAAEQTNPALFPEGMGETVRGVNTHYRAVEEAALSGYSQESLYTLYRRMSRDGAVATARTPQSSRPIAVSPVYQREVMWTDTATADDTPVTTSVGTAPNVAGFWGEGTGEIAVAQPGNDIRRSVRTRSRNEEPDGERRKCRFEELVSNEMYHARSSGHYYRTDAQWVNGELAKASEAWEYNKPELWPWPGKPFNRGNYNEQARLVKATALIRAEQDRLIRAAGEETPESREIGLEVRRLMNKGADSFIPRPSAEEVWEEIPDPF